MDKKQEQEQEQLEEEQEKEEAKEYSPCSQQLSAANSMVVSGVTPRSPITTTTCSPRKVDGGGSCDDGSLQAQAIGFEPMCSVVRTASWSRVLYAASVTASRSPDEEEEEEGNSLEEKRGLVEDEEADIFKADTVNEVDAACIEMCVCVCVCVCV